MAEISRAVRNDSDTQLYEVGRPTVWRNVTETDYNQGHASTLIAKWQSLVFSSDHSRILGTFGDDDSWSLTYNLYADRLLGTNLVTKLVCGPSLIES